MHKLVPGHRGICGGPAYLPGREGGERERGRDKTNKLSSDNVETTRYVEAVRLRLRLGFGLGIDRQRKHGGRSDTHTHTHTDRDTHTEMRQGQFRRDRTDGAFLDTRSADEMTRQEMTMTTIYKRRATPNPSHQKSNNIFSRLILNLLFALEFPNIPK